MKTFFLFVLALAAAAFSGQTATLSGTVTNAGTGKPAAGQTVFVLDSLTNYFDSTFTNASGQYSFSLGSRVDSNDVLLVYTSGCGKRTIGIYQYLGSNLVANLYICPALYSLNGTVTLGGAPNNGPARLFLLSKHYDSLRQDTVLSTIDTIYTDLTGGSYSKNFSVIPSGSLMMKAELLPSHPQYGQFLPTWFGGALVWSNAVPLTASNFSAYTATGISLVAADNPGGSASASGMVTTAGTNGQAGRPLSGRLLLLTNAVGNAVGFAESDSAGVFQFASLAFGTYKLFGDSWGRLNPALTFTLTSAHPDMDQIIFEEDSISFRGRLAGIVTAVPAGKASQALRLFPNPAGSEIFLSGLDATHGSSQVLLYDMTGSLLSHENVSGNTVRIDLSGIPAGSYLMQVRGPQDVTWFRFQTR